MGDPTVSAAAFAEQLLLRPLYRVSSNGFSVCGMVSEGLS
jgi:hypothetical protein